MKIELQLSVSGLWWQTSRVCLLRISSQIAAGQMHGTHRVRVGDVNHGALNAHTCKSDATC